jgi:ligand-binding sensor domain-containing protein
MPNNCCALTFAGLLLCSFFSAGSILARAAEFADSPYIVSQWKTEQGLPQNSVTAMARSRAGYLWLGTAKGLVRFDGVHFQVFDRSNTQGLGSNRIDYLYEDRQTNLWVGTESGIARIDRTGRATTVDPGRGASGSRLMSACEDANGAVWLYLAAGNLCRFKDGKASLLNAGVGSASRYRGVIAEPAGPVWIGTDDGLIALNPDADLSASALPIRQFLPTKVQFLLASRDGGYWRLADNQVQKWKDNRLDMDLRSFPKGVTNINAACEDRDGHLVIGTQTEGIYWYKNPWNPTHLTSEQGLPRANILSLCADDDGNLWVGTDGAGLVRIRERLFRVLAGTEKLPIQSFCDDREGGFWLAISGGKLAHWKNGTLTHYGAGQGLLDPDVRSVYVDRNHELWVGTAQGGLFKLQGDSFEQAPDSEELSPISAIYQDRGGRLWFGTQHGLMCLDGKKWTTYESHEGSALDSVQAIVEDARTNLWIGTEKDGLARFYDNKLSFFNKRDHGLPSDDVTALCVDSDDVLWIGTSAGLARLHEKEAARYTTDQGLASNEIDSLIEDGQGNLWIGSNVGFMRLPKSRQNGLARSSNGSITCHLYGESDGLPAPGSSRGSQPMACRTPDGRLWFATARGLVSVQPAEAR